MRFVLNKNSADQSPLNTDAKHGRNSRIFIIVNICFDQFEFSDRYKLLLTLVYRYYRYQRVINLAILLILNFIEILK